MKYILDIFDIYNISEIYTFLRFWVLVDIFTFTYIFTFTIYVKSTFWKVLAEIVLGIGRYIYIYNIREKHILEGIGGAP